MVVSIETLKEPLVISSRDLKKPYFRPPLQGVSKQLNPLSKAADRVAAPASRASFSALPPPSRPLETSGWARVGESGRKERKRSKALTEDGLKEALSRVLPAVLAEMGLLSARRGAERPKAPPTAGKITRQSGAAPQKGAGNAAAVAARPAPTPKEATPSILELWTEVVSKKTRKKAVKAAERATKTAPPPVARPTRVLPIPPPNPPQQPSSKKKKKKKKGGRGGGQGGPGGQTPGGASSLGPARATKIRPPTTAAVTVWRPWPSGHSMHSKGGGCPVCRDAGKPAEHRIGAKGCLANKPQQAPPSTDGRKEAGPSTIPVPTPPPAPVPMVVLRRKLLSRKGRGA
ncbi:translation initiation factor IF-2-like [Solenopsis invicta]|uniref:translation initiation factor IF-2-like n=1 Tax=Solenopsis invicta TaxID=13686 RepID=UPI00193D1438|nr:translation initiation factor IF-2-like [Solenopsis invicta]